MDKCNVLTQHANVLNNLHKIHLEPSAKIRFIMCNLYIMRNGGSGEYKYKFYPSMEPKRVIPLSWSDHYQQFIRRRAITSELKVLMYKRRQAIKKITENNPTSVVPFVKSGVRRWWRIRKVENKQKKIEIKIKSTNIRRKKEQLKRKSVTEEIGEMDYLGQVVKDAYIHENIAKDPNLDHFQGWDENYLKDVHNLKLVSRPKLSRKQIKKIFQLYDTDGSGSIDRNELQVLAYSLGEIWDDQRLDEVMNEIDTDGGGDIDFEEFCYWFQNSLETMEERVSYITL